MKKRDKMKMFGKKRTPGKRKKLAKAAENMFGRNY
jgi:hypothetical protein